MKSDATKLDPSYFRADGTIKSYEERPREDKAFAQARERIAKETAERTAQRETHAQQVLRSSKERLSQLKDSKRLAAPSERSLIDTQIHIYESEIRKMEAQATETERRSTLGDNRLVQLYREEADYLEKEGRRTYPNASPDDILLAIQLARSEEWQSPEDLQAAFREVTERITDTQLRADRLKASDAQIAADKSAMESAQANLRVAESQQKLNDIRKDNDQ